MSNRLILYISMLFAGLFLVSCDVHEFPEPEVAPQAQKVLLHLDFTYELPPYKDIIYTPNSTRGPYGSGDLDLRYIINYYRSTNGKNFPTEPTGQVVVSKDLIEVLANDIELMLIPGYYKFMVWCDYSKQGSLEDNYYDTSDFSEITIIFPHTGCEDYRDAFVGTQTATVTADMLNEFVVEMERPLGKYRFIATDFDRFLSRAEEAARAEWEASRAEGREETPSEMPPIDINDYRVVIRYPGFMPHVFNMFTNRPADATTGISYNGHIIRLNDSEADLGFDYVFINGSEAPYTVAVDIYDKKGQLVGSSGSIDVPLKRSMLTTVRGEFLTTRAQGGVGVDPGFSGDINIVIP